MYLSIRINISVLIMGKTKDFNEKLEIEENLKIKLNFCFKKHSYSITI